MAFLFRPDVILLSELADRDACLHRVTVTSISNGNQNIVHTLISGSVRWACVVVTCVWRVVIFGVVEP